MTHDYRRLLQDRLDWGKLATFVPNKRLPVYNWLYFREGFSRELVGKLLDEWKPCRVLDPWCGSGTTLLACSELGLDSVGIDMLPIALLASRVKTRGYRQEKLKETAKELFSVPFEKVRDDFPYKRFFNPHVLDDVLLFHREVRRIENEQVREFFLLGLISAAVKASWLWKDGNVLKVRKHPAPPFRKFFRGRIRRMIREAGQFTVTAEVLEADPRKLPLTDKSIDAVVTSPPYLNQLDYSRVYAIENWFVGKGVTLPAYLGMEKEEQYFADLKDVLKELYRVCKPGATLGFVIGNAWFPRENRIVEADEELARLGELAGFRPREILVLNTRQALQHRTIKRGVLRESMVVMEK